jgi:cytochrome c5
MQTINIQPKKCTGPALVASAILAVLALAAALKAEEPKSAQSSAPVAPPSATVATNTSVHPTPAKTKPAAKELTGPELYSMHCMRCHPERYPNERTSAQWKTILLHMRVRANLPAEHARKVLKYLQENSGY